MKRFPFRSVLAALVVWCFVPSAQAYVNNGAVTIVPVIDDVSFVNNGLIQIATELPFETQNTLYFTNSGTILAGSFFGGSFANGGVRFEYINGATGYRSPASVIENEQGAAITGRPYVLLNATNIVNRGTFTVPADGLIRLTGQNVDLSRGKLDLGALDGNSLSDGYVTDTNLFVGASGVTDLHWGTDTVDLPLASFFKLLPSGAQVTTPGYRVFPDGRIVMSLKSPSTYLYQQFDGPPKTPTNQIIQAVFVLNGNTNINVDVSFLDSDERTNRFKIPTVQFSGFETNVITRQKQLRSIWLSDSLTANSLLFADTNVFLNTNGIAGSFRPENFDIYRNGVGGARPNGTLTNDTFLKFLSPEFTNGMAYTNATVPAFYSAYKAYINGQLTFGANLPDADITNYGGRLEINADNLNLQDARIRGVGVVNAKTKNLVSSAGAVIDVPYLYYDLDSADGNLVLRNLIAPSVSRFASGTIQAWSALWTNGFSVNVTNTTVGTDGTTNSEVTAQDYQTVFHVLLVASALDTIGSVDITGLNTRATNTTVADKVSISRRFQTSSDTLSIDGEFKLGTLTASTLFDFGATNAPNLRYLTNRGIMNIAGYANFGSDRATPYEVFNNSRTNLATGFSITSKVFQNSGSLQSSFGPISIVAGSAALDGNDSLVRSPKDISLTATTLKVRGGSVRSSRGIQLAVTDSLTDAGISTPTTFVSSYGFSLATLPKVSSLLGANFEVNTTEGGTADISWPGNDLGAGPSGYVNNAVIGHLVLNLAPDSLLTLTETGSKNALYVDYLEMNSAIADDLASYVDIGAGMTLYFADSNIPIEKLDGALGGHIKWVSTYAGPRSGVDVALGNGKTIRINRALFDSKSIDSDSDGIANGFDTTPFGGVPVTVKVINLPPLTTEISWIGAPKTAYRVEAAASLSPTLWDLVSRVTNNAAVSVPLSVREPVPADNAVRYFRVTYEP